MTNYTTDYNISNSFFTKILTLYQNNQQFQSQLIKYKNRQAI